MPLTQQQIDLANALKEPFPADVLGWKPQSVKGNRALAVCFIDARDVMNRLDEVFGVDGWQDAYAQQPNGSVMCQLRVKVDGQWIEKCDVGNESDQPDSGDKFKSAVSDSLKRAAVKLGIGRYLYSLPLQWHDYDPTKKQFASPPRLPPWALPKGAKPQPAPQQQPATTPPVQPTPQTAPNAETMTGPKLLATLSDYEKKLAGEGLCSLGDVMSKVAERTDEWVESPDKWSKEQVEDVRLFAKGIVEKIKAKKGK
jgi:hypothetical protein